MENNPDFKKVQIKKNAGNEALINQDKINEKYDGNDMVPCARKGWESIEKNGDPAELLRS